MALDQTANFVRDSLASSVASGDTSITVSDGSTFPDPANGEYQLVVWDSENHPRPDQDPDVEVMRATAISSDTITVSRGREGTSAVSHPVNSAVQLATTAKTFSDIESELGSSPLRKSQIEWESFIETDDFTNNAIEEPLFLGAFVSSPPAMDAVSASQTARDAVNASQPAFDAVAAVNIAIGKFVAGSAGLTPSDFADMYAVSASATAMDTVSASATAMDAVSASATAMDTVSASATAMESVMGSTIARTKLLSSPAAGNVWQNPAAVDALWKTNDPITNAEPWSLEFDFSLLSELRIYAQSNVAGRPIIIEIGGSEIYNDDSDGGTYKDESFDLSGYDGVQTLTLTYSPGNLEERQLTDIKPSGYGGAGKALEFNESGENYEGRFYGLRFIRA